MSKKTMSSEKARELRIAAESIRSHLEGIVDTNASFRTILRELDALGDKSHLSNLEACALRGLVQNADLVHFAKTACKKNGAKRGVYATNPSAAPVVAIGAFLARNAKPEDFEALIRMERREQRACSVNTWLTDVARKIATEILYPKKVTEATVAKTASTPTAPPRSTRRR